MSESTAPSPDITLLDGGVNQTVNNYLVRLNLAPSTDDTDQTFQEGEDAQIERQDTQQTVETTPHTTEASVIARRALDKASTFFREKAEAFSRLPSTSRRIGTVAAASLAIAGGYIGTQEATDKVPSATAAEVEPETDGYPYANVPIGSLDEEGAPARECTSYVRWKYKTLGLDMERLSNWDINGEVVNDIPAPGSMAYKPEHAMFVKSVSLDPNSEDGGHFTVYEYNGPTGAYKFGIRNIPISEITSQQIKFVHFELPAPNKAAEDKDTPYMETTLDKRNKNSITSKRSVFEGTHLVSNNGQYKLVVKRGNLKLHDTKNNDAVKWSASTNKSASELRVVLGKGKQRGKNTLGFSTSQTMRIAGTNKTVRQQQTFKKWNIGSATKVEVGDDGKLIGYKGNNRVWEAKNIAAVPRAAKLSMPKITRRSAAKSKR